MNDNLSAGSCYLDGDISKSLIYVNTFPLNRGEIINDKPFIWPKGFSFLCLVGPI